MRRWRILIISYVEISMLLHQPLISIIKHGNREKWFMTIDSFFESTSYRICQSIWWGRVSHWRLFDSFDSIIWRSNPNWWRRTESCQPSASLKGIFLYNDHEEALYVRSLRLKFWSKSLASSVSGVRRTWGGGLNQLSVSVQGSFGGHKVPMVGRMTRRLICCGVKWIRVRANDPLTGRCR